MNEDEVLKELDIKINEIVPDLYDLISENLIQIKKEFQTKPNLEYLLVSIMSVLTIHVTTTLQINTKRDAKEYLDKIYLTSQVGIDVWNSGEENDKMD